VEADLALQPGTRPRKTSPSSTVSPPEHAVEHRLVLQQRAAGVAEQGAAGDEDGAEAEHEQQAAGQHPAAADADGRLGGEGGAGCRLARGAVLGRRSSPSSAPDSPVT
jgi:hypothetical protein